MSNTTQDAVVRRSFLARLAAVGTAIAGVVALPSTSAAQPSRGPTHPADAWLDDLKGQHKNIFDCTSVENGPMGWTFARNFLTANTGADLPAQGCRRERHRLRPPLRERLRLQRRDVGQVQAGRIAEGERGRRARREESHANTANDLAKRGVIVAVCGMALSRIARTVAADAGVSAADVEADLRANLVTPTARVVAAGVIVTNRAQEKGFTYTYVG